LPNHIWAGAESNSSWHRIREINCLPPFHWHPVRRFRMKAARFDTADYLCSTLLVWESIPCPIPAAAFSKLNNPLVLIKSHLFWCGVSSTSVCSCELPQPLLHFLISRLTKPIESNFVPFCGGRSYFSAPIQLHTIQPRANRTRSYASRSSELPMVSVFGRDNIELSCHAESFCRHGSADCIYGIQIKAPGTAPTICYVMQELCGPTAIADRKCTHFTSVISRGPH
jgi:hypothetical protein